MDKLTETEMLKLQVANLLVDNAAKAHAIATQEKNALSAQLLAKYGQPGETTLNFQTDGTIVRAPVLASVPNPEEASGG